MTDPVSPTDTEPKAHVSLKDKDNNVLHFVLYNNLGKRDHRAIKRFPLEEDVIKFTTGESQYSDDKIPTIVQEDFSGGRGNERFENDKSRFFDSKCMDTRREGVVLGGREIYATGPWRNQENYLPGSEYINANWDTYGVYFIKLRGASKYLARSFVAASTWSVKNVEVLLKYIGTPTGNVTVAIHNDNGGTPGTVRTSHTFTTADFDEVNISQLIEADLSSATTITATVTFWVLVYATAVDGANDCWLVGTGGPTAGKYSSDGSSWSSGSYSNPYFRLTDDAATFDAHFYEYKGQLYFASQPHNGTAGDVYMNGFRGACDTNTGALNKLKDSTQSFAGFYEAIAKIVAGDPNAKEQIPWRRATIDSTTQLAMNYSWLIEHTDKDEYVITGTDNWFLINDGGQITKPISDVAVGNGIVFLAQFGEGKLVKHREFNNGGTWQKTSACWTYAGAYAQYIKLLNDLSKGPTLWIARNPGNRAKYNNEYKSLVHYAPLPDAWGDGKIFFDVLDDGQDAWDEQSISYVTQSFTDNRVRFAVTNNFTTGIIGSEAISSSDLTYGNHIQFTVQSGIPMAAGDLQFLMSNLANCVTPLFALNLPSLNTNEPKTVKLKFDPEGITGIDEVISIGLQITTDKNTDWNIEIIGDVIVYYDRSPIRIGQGAENITGVEIYDDPERFWIFTEGELGYMQNDIYTPIPLREMRSMRSMYNGLASCVCGVYLYFSFGRGGVMRYFRQNLDSIGPNRDAGLPDNRKGYVSAMIGYPGDKIIIAQNGGIEAAAADQRYSSILMWSGNGWHELYRAPRPNLMIKSLYIQSVDGTETQKLWFTQGADVCWIPLSINPDADPDYRYTHEGHLITSWMYANKQALDKVFHNLALFAENLSDATETIIIGVDYQLDNDTTWTALPAYFYTSPSQTVNLTDTARTNVSGKRIRLRFRFQTTDPTTSPRMMASVLKAYAIQDIGYGYSFVTKLSEDDLSIDLEGDEVGAANYSTRVEDALALMDTWITGHYKLTFNTGYSTINNKSVYLKPMPFQPLTFLPEDQIEEELLQVVVYEFATT